MLATAWEMVSRQDVQRMADEAGSPIVWCRDVQHGFARLLREGESESEAVAEFESAGETCEGSEVYWPGAAS